MFEKMSFDGFFLRVVFLKLVFDFFFRRLGSAERMQLRSRVFPSVEVSCFVFSRSLSVECFGFDRAEFGLNSGFVVEGQEFDLFELVDKIVEFVVVGSFWNFFSGLVNRMTFEAA